MIWKVPKIFPYQFKRLGSNNPARLIIRLFFGFSSDSDTICETNSEPTMLSALKFSRLLVYRKIVSPLLVTNDGDDDDDNCDDDDENV